jgi:two-component system chemotaxis response regulator CheB
MSKKIKVFTVDDSPLFRQVLRDIIQSDPDLEYIGYASNGAIALNKLPMIQPDVITLDIEMPEMDGIQTLNRIMRSNPIPVIMVSSFTSDGADITFKALELGAVDYVEKPASQNLRANVDDLKEMLLTKIKVFSHLKHSLLKQKKKIPADDDMPILGGLPTYDVPKTRNKSVEIVCIGASTGGTVALSTILPHISRELNLPVVIVQHMPKLYTKSFARRLDTNCSLSVVEASHGEKLKPNHVYIAQGGTHMLVKNGHIEFDDSENVNHHKPSVDVLFDSVNREYRDRALGIILTGMGSDGARGIAALKDSGSFTLAQDEESSTIFGMPGSAIKTGKIDRVLPLSKIADFINDYVTYSRRK